MTTKTKTITITSTTTKQTISALEKFYCKYSRKRRGQRYPGFDKITHFIDFVHSFHFAFFSPFLTPSLKFSLLLFDYPIHRRPVGNTYQLGKESQSVTYAIAKDPTENRVNMQIDIQKTTSPVGRQGKEEDKYQSDGYLGMYIVCTHHVYVERRTGRGGKLVSFIIIIIKISPKVGTCRFPASGRDRRKTPMR